ncbi:unnamed protein product [Porites lobata]|uniref:DUF3456 domain-containing protein n=1 Tax=Porites lobata TaxID=104759 RepID=A0ABN8RXP3_9CNID|nr:unnamed protein product [Porites lobata]
MHRLIYGIAFLIVLLVNDVICSELMVDDEFVVIDGIRVKKDSIRNETSDGNRKYGKRDKKAEKTESDDEDQDEQDEDDDDEDDDEEEIDISQEEDLESTKHLPTKCHVCRLLAVEVENKLTTIGKVRKTQENGPPIYYKEKIVILKVTEDFCDSIKKYNIRAKHPFRYKRGAKSYYRKHIEEVTKESKIQKWMFATPEEDIDDPTGEIRRLKKQCHDMLVETQELLIHWFMKAQSRDLTKWLCAKRVLRDDNQDCLQVEMPKSNRVPALRPKTPKTEAKSVSHEEL